MAQVSSVDFVNKRIYLHADTVTSGIDSFLVYDEIRALFAANANGEQNHPLMLSKEGNFNKGGGRYTAKYAVYDAGWRIVPYGGVAHNLTIMVEIVSKDQLSDRDVFDRSSLAVTVDIDIGYKQNEVITVATGSGVTSQDKIDIANQVWNTVL